MWGGARRRSYVVNTARGETRRRHRTRSTDLQLIRTPSDACAAAEYRGITEQAQRGFRIRSYLHDETTRFHRLGLRPVLSGTNFGVAPVIAPARGKTSARLTPSRYSI